ncbi:MAG: RidA family protein [Planctomycetota bacterium]|nr:MAG: RidA family protein [Planctomycetota bacterium]
MDRQPIATPQAPAAIGPYSQAMQSGGQLWISGQLGLDPVSGNLVEGGIEAQTRQALANLQAICEAAGTSLHQALRCTIYLTDLRDFALVNGLYAEAFSQPYPARACIQVAALPKGGVVEIDAVVALKHHAH